MHLTLNQIETGPPERQFDISLAPTDGRVTGGPLQVATQLRLYDEQVFVKGTYQAQLSATCDLCGVHFDFAQTGELDLVLLPAENKDVAASDVELSLDMLDQDFYQGGEIHLDTYFEDQLMLDLPMQLRCKSDCKGLCSRCGGDLNQGACNCGLDHSNSPFAVLKNMINLE